MKLSALCQKIGSGATPKGGSTVYVSQGVSLIRSQNVYNNQFEYGGLCHITDEAARKLDSVTVQEGDVLLNITGDSVARCAIVPGEVLPARVNQHVAIIRPKKDLLDNRFLMYYLTSPRMQALMLGVAVGKGASRNALTKGMIENFDFPCLSIVEQRKIVNILAPYDSLIENNRRQIKLLEEAAQRLYKEWFVDLRFPGHEHTPIVNGIPQGWRKCLLPDFAEILYGYPFNGKLFNSNGKGKPIVRIRNVPSGVSDDYTTEQAPDAYVVKNGDVLVGMDGEFHMNTWSGGDAYLVQRTCCIRPVNEIAKGYLLQALYAPIKFFEKTLVGATVAHLGKKHLDSIELLLPDRDSLLLPFMELTKQRQTLLSENVILTEARDRLLPKLMSGAVEV